MTPTIEEVKRVAEECGIGLAHQTFQAAALQTFAQHWIEVGRKMQRESDASICEKSDRYRGDYFAELIRNNTGE